MSLTLIWAMSQNGVIGRDNALPWRLPADLKYFKAQTMGKKMVMGRKTWESMGSKPLPGRESLVLTNDNSYVAEGATILHQIDQVLALAKTEEIMVIGGAGVFQHLIPYADVLLVTLIKEEVAGDVVFPEIDWNQYKLVQEIAGVRDEKNNYDYSFLTYHRLS
jgi:dihydrofolate reductase